MVRGGMRGGEGMVRGGDDEGRSEGSKGKV